MLAHFIGRRIKYDGLQIKSNWALKTAGIKGDNIVSFIGPCNIPSRNIVDLEDIESNSKISGPLMLHFIIEMFGQGLEKAILYQRLLTAIVKDGLEIKIGRLLKRVGDDIYDSDAKLSISIATLTPYSAKIHFAVNIISKGTPVKTKGLADYKIEPRKFAFLIMDAFIKESVTINKASHKVRKVK